MAINKVTKDGATLIDLSQDTVTSAADIKAGKIGHDKDGNQVTGTYDPQPVLDTLTVDGSGTITPPQGVDGFDEVIVPAGTEGTPTASKGAVSNHSVAVTPSVINTAGYITGGEKTGTPVTVSASELVSGSETKAANGAYDVTNLAQLVVAIPVYDGSVV